MTDHYLKPEQEQRALALSLAHPLLVSKTLGGERSIDIFDLMRLAQWILDGTDMIDTIGHPVPPSLGKVPDWSPVPAWDGTERDFTDAADEEDERV